MQIIVWLNVFVFYIKHLKKKKNSLVKKLTASINSVNVTIKILH